MKIFIKNTTLKIDIQNQIEEIKTYIQKRTNESVKNMTILMNEERLKISWLDKIFNLIGFSKMRKEPVTEDEIRKFININELYCSQLYASLNIRTSWKDDMLLHYTYSPAYKYMFSSMWLHNLKKLKNLLKMIEKNNQLFSELNEEDFKLIYE